MADNVSHLDARRKLKLVDAHVRVAHDAPLFGGGGGGTSGGMDAVDAKVAAAEARTDTKFAELRGDLSSFATKGTVWGAMGTALGIILAVLAFAANRFDAGVSAGGAVAPYVTQQQQRDAAQDKKLDEILRRLPPQKR
jgi:hypothetical protein